MPPPYTLLTGTSSHETIDARGFGSAHEIRALHGHDTIYGTDFGDLIVGGTGNDYQSGGLGDDLFLIEGSGQGVDNILGGGGFDTVLGGAGDDVFDIRQFSGVERIDGGGGTNVLLGSVTNYWNLTGVEILGISLIDLAGGSDNVTLSSGDDRFAGGAGNDTVDGGLGRDTAVYLGNFADYTLTALSGGRVRVADSVNGEGTDTLTGVEVLEFADGAYEGGVFTPFGDPNNTAPVASDDAYGATEDTLLTVDAASGVLGNDTDADLDGLTVDSFDAVSANGGTVSMNADGSFTYTGAADFAGADSFDYTIADGRGGFSTATVDLNVAAVNDAPVAVGDSYAGLSDIAVVMDAASGVLSNDTDADGDGLSVDSYDAVSVNGGTVSMNADGSFTYTPAAGYTGTDTFAYTVTDGNNATDTQTVSVSVTATPPVTTFDTIIAGLAENEWVRLNTNSFQDVWTPAELRAGNGNPRSVIQAWSAATWDSNRNDYIFTGGGHANYGGNEVYRWSSATLEWERASLPSEIVNVQGSQYETVDGYENTPISSHLYDNLEFLDGADRMVSFGGAAYNTGGGFITTDESMNTGPYFWNPALGDPDQVGGLTGSHVDPANNTGIVGGNMWENRQTSETTGPYPDRMLNGVTDYAVVNGVETVFVGEGDGHLYQYSVPDVGDASQDSWTQVGRFWSAFSGAGAGAYSAADNIFVRTAGGFFTYWDLDTAGAGNNNVLFNPTDLTGGFSLDATYGMEYDPVRDRFVLWDGEADVWYLTAPDTGLSATGWEIERAPTSTVQDVPTTPSVFTGVLGKWDYVDDYDIFVGVVDDITGDVWAYKPEGWDPANGLDTQSIQDSDIQPLVSAIASFDPPPPGEASYDPGADDANTGLNLVPNSWQAA